VDWRLFCTQSEHCIGETEVKPQALAKAFKNPHAVGGARKMRLAVRKPCFLKTYFQRICGIRAGDTGGQH
jgi:hypothetical protein